MISEDIGTRRKEALPDAMRAQCIHSLGDLEAPGERLVGRHLPVPRPAPGEVLIEVQFCGVCHTEIDEIENRTPPASLPMTPGHQVIGVVVAEGRECRRGLLHQAVGVAWIFSACGHCNYCLSGRENLCPVFIACGRDRAGGYAEYMVAPEAFVYRLPDTIPLPNLAPLLCAGAVGFRALNSARLADGEALGLTGFGASGRLVLQMAKNLYPAVGVYVFARNPAERALALEIGADWAGDTGDTPPGPVDAIIDTTPAWRPVLAALQALQPGGRLIINAIRKESSDRHVLEELDYAAHLWMEKSVQSIANVTRADVTGVLELAARAGLVPDVRIYPLEHALDALKDIKRGDIRAAGVIRLQ